MKYIKTLVLDRGKLVSITQFTTLICVATMAPLFHNQIITGSIVNATLFVGVALLGMRKGVMIGLVPSVVALSVGTLPALLAPVIPLIMISNTILILIFNKLRKRNIGLAVIIASLSKFTFLFLTSSVVISLLFQDGLVQKMMSMMGPVQFLTALIGGFLSIMFLKRHNQIHQDYTTSI